MKGLENMTALILDQAQKDADRILADAQNDADAILSEYRKKAEEERRSELTAAGAEASLFTCRAEASAQQIRRNLLLKTKNDLLDRAFSNALTALTKLDAKESLSIYTAIFAQALESQLAAECAALENDLYEEYTAPSQYELVLSQTDSARLGNDLQKAAAELAKPYGKQVVLSSRNIAIRGGFILICGDIELNCSLSTYMEQIRSKIEGEVCQILFA